MRSKLPSPIALLATAVLGCSISPTNSTEVAIEDETTEAGNLTETPITLTQAAAEKVRAIMAQNALGKDNHLRVAVEEGGPTGFTYDLKFANDADADKDLIFMSRGIRIAVDRRSSLFLDGTKVDFLEQSPEGAGFKFNNPNAIEE